MADWKELVKEISSAAEKMREVEPDDHKRLRLGLIESGAGSYGQYFSTWVAAYARVEGLGWFALTPILKLLNNPSFDLEQIRILLRTFIPPYVEFLNYCGLTEVNRLANKALEALGTVGTKEDCKLLVEALSIYVNQLMKWVYHYFPFGVGVFFRHKTGEEIEELYRLSRGK